MDVRLGHLARLFGEGHARDEFPDLGVAGGEPRGRGGESGAGEQGGARSEKQAGGKRDWFHQGVPSRISNRVVRVSAELVPTITSNSPGSTTRFMSMSWNSSLFGVRMND